LLTRRCDQYNAARTERGPDGRRVESKWPVDLADHRDRSSAMLMR
jgi:hypothetical protein